MSFLKDKPQFKEGLRVADGPVEAVEPPIEYEFIITLKDGSHTRHDPETVVVYMPNYIRVGGPRPREYTIYPVTSINWYGLQEVAPIRVQSSEGDAA